MKKTIVYKQHTIHLISPITNVHLPNTNNYNILRLVRSCIKNNAPINFIGIGKSYTPYFKNECLTEYISDLDNNDIIILTDGYDAYLTSTISEIIDKFLNFNTPIVLMADIMCYPDESLETKFIKKNKFYNYANIGGIVGYVCDLKDVLFKLSNTYEKEILIKHSNFISKDQLSWQWYFLKDQDPIKQNKITIDYNCEIFLTTAQYNLEDNYINKFGDRYINTRTNSKPCFLHGAGNTGLVALKRILNE